MARGKHAVALFEVIQSSRRSRRGLGDVLRTPKWWFKGRSDRGGDSAAAAPGSSTPGPIAISETDPQMISNAPAPRAAGIDLKLDPDSQRITFRVSYTSAIVAAFTVLVVVALAYVIGHHVARGPSPAVAGPSTEQLRAGPARPEVLDVKSLPKAPAPAPVPAEETEDAVTPLPSAPTQASAQPLAAPPVAQTPAVHEGAEVNGQRIIGRNYVVVQIYPDEKSATEARDLLAKSGVPCTIEKGLSGYAATNWYCVVGLTGFDRIRNNSEFDRYEKLIRDIGNKFAGNSKFKKFDPQAYRWKG
jgi:hypothetical protein